MPFAPGSDSRPTVARRRSARRARRETSTAGGRASKAATSTVHQGADSRGDRDDGGERDEPDDGRVEIKFRHRKLALRPFAGTCRARGFECH